MEHGQVSTEANMMAELAARGPIACGLCVTDEFEVICILYLDFKIKHSVPC